MCKFSSPSKSILWVVYLFLITVANISCAGKVAAYNGDGEVYVVLPEDYDSKKDLKWSEYLYRHMRHRGGDDYAPVFYDIYDIADSKFVTVHLDEDAEEDFRIKNDENGLHLTARNERTMIWLIHQYMRMIGDVDERFPNSDLPAAIISFNDTVATFSFRYRDVYSPTNRQEDTRGILGLNNIDTDWGIWGHNIALTLPDEPDRDIYAYHEGQRVGSQFCFSSDKLYKYICGYIIDNCGDGNSVSYNFAIIPNDNNIACLCARCQGLGNTVGNATPAVTKMIRKLAARFQNHIFFTSAYHTTGKPCKHELPNNAGVIVSAIDWQPGAELKGKRVSQFEKIIKEWSAKTKNIYVWDYINNYDDYFTPYPILKSMQRRFKIYRDNGIKGIFLNGSGYDYSTFEDMHTNLLAVLMMNPDVNVESLVKDYFCRTYPVAGEAISDYYCSLLKNEESTDKVIPIYGGIDEKIDLFLDPQSFVEFYDTITILKNRADEDEAFQLRKLITALSFTRLEIARNAGYGKYGFASLGKNNRIQVDKYIYELLDIFDNGYKAFELFKINEAGDKSADYVDSWKKYILQVKYRPNVLYGEDLTVVSENGKQQMKGLTDGAPAIPNSYFYGWNIIPEQEISIKLNPLGATTLKMNFLSLLRHRIEIPSKIEIFCGNEMVARYKPKAPHKDGPQLIAWEEKLGNIINKKEITVKIYSSGRYHIAIDEISLIK